MTLHFGILNGPNLNWLGRREPSLYGRQSWEEIFASLKGWGESQQILLTFFQSNHEGVLIDTLQEWNHKVEGIIFNPGAYAHTSIALRDSVAVLSVPVVEVHLSKTQQREPFRRHSYLSDVVEATITGFGAQGYFLGLAFLKYLV